MAELIRNADDISPAKIVPVREAIRLCMDTLSHHDLPLSAELLPLRERNGNSSTDM